MFRVDHSQTAQLLRETHPLIDVMPRPYHRRLRIPGAINIPVQEEDFVEQVDAVVEDRHRALVVHDAGNDCDLARQACERLEAAGFSDVRLFVAGTAGWRSAGYLVKVGELDTSGDANGVDRAC
jgi:rhodanese-related sulfurtransferase